METNLERRPAKRPSRSQSGKNTIENVKSRRNWKKKHGTPFELPDLTQIGNFNKKDQVFKLVTFNPFQSPPFLTILASVHHSRVR